MIIASHEFSEMTKSACTIYHLAGGTLKTMAKSPAGASVDPEDFL